MWEHKDRSESVACMLSGWPSTNAGGKCPTSTCIWVEVVDKLKCFVTHALMGSVNISTSKWYALVCML